MLYAEYPIFPQLAPFVKVIWSMESEPDETPDLSMRILPDSCVEMVVHYRQPLTTTFSTARQGTQPTSFVVAQMKNFIDLSPTGHYGFMSIRFSAKGAYHFFRQPMKEIVNGVVDLKNIWTTIANEIEDKVASAKNGQQRSYIIQHHLTQQLKQNGEYDHAIDFSVNELIDAKGQLSIEQLALKIGLSSRQLVRRFDKKIGMPPKEFASILRFINATHLLRNKQHSIYDIAYLCGFYDHAHFFHEFKKFSGLKPGQFQERSDVFL